MSPLDRKARASRRGAMFFADTVAPVRSVVLDRAEALEEDAREAELARLLPVASWSSTLPNYPEMLPPTTDGGAILTNAADLEARLDAQEHPRAVAPEIRTMAEALARTSPRVGK